MGREKRRKERGRAWDDTERKRGRGEGEGDERLKRGEEKKGKRE